MILATLLYVRRDHRTLMIHRVKKPSDMHEGKWNGLGGKLEPGESPEECAIRELREECGLEARHPRLKGVLTFPLFSKGQDWYVFVFEITEFSGELKECPEGDLAWIDDDKLLSLNLWEGDLHFLRWMREHRFFSGRFVYEDGRLVSHTEAFYD